MSRASRGPSQRQLRVSEVLRHALSDVLNRGDIRDPALSGTTVTVVEVTASPDLRRATAYVMPLGGDNQDAVLAALGRAARYIRGQIARSVDLKYTPEIVFRLDSSFDYADKVGSILRDPKVAQDLD